MKNILFIVLILTSYNLYAQSSDSTMNYLTKGKWYMRSISGNGKKYNFTKKEEDSNWAEFSANNSLKAMEYGEIYSGKWHYNTQNMIIETHDRDGITKMKILTISDTTLKVEIKEANGSITYIIMVQH